MTPRTPLRELGHVLERLLEEPDARRRERLVVHGVFDAGLASAVAMYAEGEPWQRLVGCGATDGLPGADLVASVAAGDIGPDLPPDRLVVVAGAAPRRRALALSGGLGDEGRADLFEALLVFLSCLTVDPESELDDRVLPPFQHGAGERRPVGADIAHDLRGLLRSIRSRQEELDLLEHTLDDEEREHLAQVMDLECQLAGDLLLDAFATGRPAEDPGHVEVGRPSRWRSILEEVAHGRAPQLSAAGCPLRVSVIDPGAIELGASEVEFRSVVELLLDVAAHLHGGGQRRAGDGPKGVDLSLCAARSARVRGLRVCVETVRSDRSPRESAASRVTQLRQRVGRLGGELDCTLPERGAARIALWFPRA